MQLVSNKVKAIYKVFMISIPIRFDFLSSVFVDDASIHLTIIATSRSTRRLEENMQARWDFSHMSRRTGQLALQKKSGQHY
jgi:hypothetical protein